MPCRISMCAGRRRFAAAFLAAATVLLLADVTFPPRAVAQSFDATTLSQPTDLGMNWLLHAGDDPAYAEPGFDDSQWTVVDPNQSLKSYFPNSQPNVIWYRLHVKAAPNQQGLALEEYNLSSAFDIYVNGRKLLTAGTVSPYRPSTFNARLLARIPDAEIGTGSLLIAMRMYVSANEWVNSFPGFYSYNLAIGQEAALHDRIWLTLIGQNALNWFFQLIGIGLGFIALALFTAQRDHKENLWVFLLFLSAFLQAPFQLYLLQHTFPAWWAYISGCFQIAILVFQVLTFLAFLRMRVERWILIWLVAGAVGTLYGSMQIANGYGSSASVLLSTIPSLSMLAGVLPLLLLTHWRRGNREAGILLVPAIVSSLTSYLQLGIFLANTVPALAMATMRFRQIVFNWTVGPFVMDPGSLVGCLYVLSLGLILVLRSTRIARQRANLETEMAAAREVQQVILPEQTETPPGFAIESAYEPAQQVGGDFYQILAAPENSLLVVIGDVAGKGLPAAMMVSVLVGAIRGVAEYTSDPSELLASLNQRLVGRVGRNFSTALAARIFSNGVVALASAGHLPPYLDGREVEVQGALPLGVQAGTRYETVRFQFPRGSRLTFYSDGIVEAQNAAGEMFGFERSRRISTDPVAKIIAAARLFGQQDDMTAISITRQAASESPAWADESFAPELGVIAS